jgi:general secretion pathway protein M
MNQLKEALTRASAWYQTLTQRERRLVALAGASVVAFVLFVVIFTFAGTAASIRSRTQAKVQKLDEVQTLAAGFREQEAKRAAIEAQLRASNVRLASYLEEKANKAGLEIPSINPRADVTLAGDKILESSVEVTLTDIKINRLVDFLQYVEQGPGMVKVKYLRVEPRPANETLTAWVTVATYKLKN